MCQSTKVDGLLEWCKSAGIWIDPRLEVRVTADHGIAVFSNTLLATPDTALVHIPQTAVLSSQSCSFSELIPKIPVGHGAQLALALALYTEQLKGQQSRWFGYLTSLPSDGVDIPLLWGHRDSKCSEQHMDDRTEASEWLRGTEVEKELFKDSIDAPGRRISLLEETLKYYCDVVEPLVTKHWTLLADKPLSPSLEAFFRTYSLVSSRAFIVDAYHGLAMVPIADAFNHSQENHVHLESDYDVCPSCGSLYECEHDEEEITDGATAGAMTPGIRPQRVDTDADPIHNLDSYYEMVTNAPIAAHSEVFNTYGETLTNAQLLARYGFILDVNDYDRLTWELPEVSMILAQELTKDISVMEHLWKEALKDYCSLWVRLQDSSLVYFNPQSALLSQSAITEDRRCFCINGDGKISHQLWLYCALLNHTPQDPTDLGVLLDRLVAAQLGKENMLEGEPRDGSDATDDLIAGIADAVVSLCAARKAILGKVSALTHDQQLGDILDALPQDMSRTRLAITQVMSELSILESCSASWKELASDL